MTSHQLTDEALWQALKKSDMKAFDTLYDRYWMQVFTTAFFYLKNRETCMEIVHDIFVNLWQKREHLQVMSMCAYLQASARYHSFKVMKAKESEKTSIRFLSDRPLPATSNTGEEKILYREMEHAVEIHMNKLPKRCLEIFNLSRKELLSNDEIAIQLGISKRTVENQITYALQHLRMLAFA